MLLIIHFNVYHHQVWKTYDLNILLVSKIHPSCKNNWNKFFFCLFVSIVFVGSSIVAAAVFVAVTVAIAVVVVVRVAARASLLIVHVILKNNQFDSFDKFHSNFLQDDSVKKFENLKTRVNEVENGIVFDKTNDLIFFTFKNICRAGFLTEIYSWPLQGQGSIFIFLLLT